jgi:beta-xylosidase
MITPKLLFFLFIFNGNLFAQSDSATVYMFSYFKNNGQDGLHLAYSYDGYRFTALNNDSSFLRPMVNKDRLMRDPCIIRGTDNLFHMVWTVSWNARGIGYASSPDLVHWSEQQYLPVMEHEDSARNSWAPEVTYDTMGNRYMIYWASTIAGKFPSDTAIERGYNHRMYYTTTTDFKKFSATGLLYDQGFNVIDASIIPNGNTYIMFLKDETRVPSPEKNIRIAYSSQATGAYSKPSAPITGNYWAEGPTVVKIGNEWLVYFDKYRDHVYGAVRSEDLVNWTDVSSKISFPAGARHGTVFTITREEFKRFFQERSL